MRFNIHTLLFLLGMGLPFALIGQIRPQNHSVLEAGGGINLSYFDIGGGSPAPSFAGSFLFGLGDSWKAGPEVKFHRTRGSDQGTTNESRGYDFKSNIYELSARGVYIIRFSQYPYKQWKRSLRPRIFASLGLLQIQPVYNREMAMENDKEYLPLAFSASGGLGLEYALNNDIGLLLEAGSTLSSSDYLEGYTNDQFSKARDMFHSICLKISYRIPTGWD